MKNQKGFTLIELLVVIAIIGVMAALVIVNLSSANKKSRDSKRKADLAEIKTALELYFDEELLYPTATADLDGTSSAVTTALEPDYIKQVPTDPRNNGVYVYNYTGTSDAFTVSAVLEKDGSTVADYFVYESN